MRPHLFHLALALSNLRGDILLLFSVRLKRDELRNLLIPNGKQAEYLVIPSAIWNGTNDTFGSINPVLAVTVGRWVQICRHMLRALCVQCSA